VEHYLLMAGHKKFSTLRDAMTPEQHAAAQVKFVELDAPKLTQEWADGADAYVAHALVRKATPR
jgi:hypothetical protein